MEGELWGDIERDIVAVRGAVLCQLKDTVRGHKRQCPVYARIRGSGATTTQVSASDGLDTLPDEQGAVRVDGGEGKGRDLSCS